MTSVLITIDTPDGPLDLSVPARTTIEHLLAMVARSGSEDPADRTLVVAGGPMLDPSQTLEAAGLLDGVRLSLVPVGVPQASVPPAAPSTRAAAVDPAQRVVPARMPTGERVRFAAGALLGRHRPAGARGPLDRMQRAWAWTDHERRLRWLISRPRVNRSIFIGVAGHRSDELAESLADTLAVARRERVVLVDGGTGAITRRLRELGAGVEAVESGLRRRDISSIERDLLFGRTSSGTLAVPVAPTGPVPDAATMRRMTDSLPIHATLIVIDCGSAEQPNAALVQRCDQLVASTTGAVPASTVQTIAAVWGEAETARDRGLYASHPISDDPISVAELAVVVAGGWSAIQAATRVPLGL